MSSKAVQGLPAVEHQLPSGELWRSVRRFTMRVFPARVMVTLLPQA